MVRKTVFFTALLLTSASAYALDLEREYLLNVYHGVESEQPNKVNPAQSWTNISNGIKQDSQSDNQSAIKFSSLADKEEAQTEVGFFSGRSIDEEEVKKQERYGYSSGSNIETPEDDSYGVYFKQRF